MLALVAAACSGDREPSPSEGTRSTSLASEVSDTTTDADDWAKGARHTVTIRSRTEDDARAAFSEVASFEQKRGRPANSIRIKAGALASVSENGSCGGALLAFLHEYGVLLMDAPPPPDMDPIELRVHLPPAGHSREGVDGTLLMMRQDVDSFHVWDNLVSARCAGDALVAVWGRVFDPADSPARHHTLAVASEDAARALFTSSLGAAAVAAGGPIQPMLWIFDERVLWMMGRERIDAVTGQVLEPIADPLVHPGDAQGGAP